MTLLDATFGYVQAPGEREVRALRQVREVYGIWRLALDEAQRGIRVEYDASRLSASDVESLLRNAGIDLADKLALAASPIPTS